MPADLIFLGGRVHTVNGADEIAQAVAVAKDRIVAVGRDDEVKGLAGPKTRVVELKGRSLLPGFIDAHCHLASLGMSFVSIDCKAPGMGVDALLNNTGGVGNTAVGYRALTDGTNSLNTGIGSEALTHATGGGNTALGYSAGINVTTGNNNIHIRNTGDPADSLTIRIGDTQTRTFIAGIYGATIDAGTATNLGIDANGQLGTLASSRRVKTDIEPVGERSQGLHALRPVSFRYRAQPPDGSVQYGLIAEEVAEVYSELVVRDGDGAPQTVRYQLLPALLLNELQRQERALHEKDRRLEAQGESLRTQQAELAAMAKTVANLVSRIAQMESRAARTGLRPPASP